MTMNMTEDMDHDGGAHDHNLHVPSQDVFADATGPEHSLDHHVASREGIPAFFQTDSLSAVPVTERASESGNIRAVGFVEPYKLVGHRRGRRSVSLSCPTTVTSTAGVASTPKGFQVSDDRSYLDIGAGLQVNPGDSFTFEAESEIWVAPLPNNIAGYCQYVETFDAPSGPQP